MKPSELSLKYIPGNWTIGKIVHPSTKIVQTVNLADKLLPERTQEEHVKHKIKAAKDEFTAVDAPLYNSLF